METAFTRNLALPKAVDPLQSGYFLFTQHIRANIFFYISNLLRQSRYLLTCRSDL